MCATEFARARVSCSTHPLFYLAVQRQERVVSLASSLEPGRFPVEESGHAEITGYCAAPSYAWKRVTITTTAGQDMERFFGKWLRKCATRRHDDTAKSPRVRWSLIGDRLWSSSSWVGSRPYITASSPSILTLKCVQSLLKVLHPWNSGHQPPVLPEAGGKRTDYTIFCCLPHASVALCSPLPRARPNYSLQADV